MSNEILVDTDAFSIMLDKRANHEAYARELVGHIPLLCFATIAELRFGAAKAGWGERRNKDLEEMLRRFVVTPYDAQLAIMWGNLRAQAQSTGHALGAPEQIHDLWIAATAIYRQAPLLTRNRRHFEGFPGLVLITPKTDP